MNLLILLTNIGTALGTSLLFWGWRQDLRREATFWHRLYVSTDQAHQTLVKLAIQMRAQIERLTTHQRIRKFDTRD